jgi:hypothetical protein
MLVLIENDTVTSLLLARGAGRPVRRGGFATLSFSPLIERYSGVFGINGGNSTARFKFAGPVAASRLIPQCFPQ